MQPLWWFGGHAFFAVLLIGAGVFLLSPAFAEHERTDVPPPPTTHATHATETAEAPRQTTVPTASPTPPPPTTPVDVAFSPAPPPRPASPRRRRGGLGVLTFGILLIGAGVTGLALASGASIEPANAFAVGLLV